MHPNPAVADLRLVAQRTPSNAPAANPQTEPPVVPSAIQGKLKPVLTPS